MSSKERIDELTKAGSAANRANVAEKKRARPSVLPFLDNKSKSIANEASMQNVYLTASVRTPICRFGELRRQVHQRPTSPVERASDSSVRTAIA